MAKRKRSAKAGQARGQSWVDGQEAWEKASPAERRRVDREIRDWFLLKGLEAKADAAEIRDQRIIEYISKPLPRLDVEELKILRALAKEGRAMYQHELVEVTRLSRGTIGKRLLRLRNLGLISYPEGKQRGNAITQEGRRVIKRIS